MTKKAKPTYLEIISLAEDLDIPTTWENDKGKIRPVPIKNICAAIKYVIQKSRRGFAEHTNLEKKGVK